MRTIKIMLTVALLGVFTVSQAQEREMKPERKGHFLQKADTDGDGKISIVEFNAVKAEREAERIERRKEHFAELDVNKDGVITFDEFDIKPPRMHNEEMPKEDFSFENLDVDKDGYLTRKELKEHREHLMKKHKGFRKGKRMLRSK